MRRHDPNLCDNMFEKASKSTVMTSIPIILSFCMSITILTLSGRQPPAMAIYPSTAGPLNILAWEFTCKSELILYLSPFSFVEEETGDIYGCQWRPRNAIFRFVVAGCMALTCMLSMCLLKWPSCRGISCGGCWPVVYWINWLLFVMMFVVFVLDCDGINTGFNSCLNDFEVEGEQLIADNSPLDSGALLAFPTEMHVDECLVTPFAWTAMCDLVASLVMFCAYKISRYYIFDAQQRKESIAATTSQPSNPQANPPEIRNTTQTVQTVQVNGGLSTQIGTGGHGNDAGQKREESESPDPFADYQGSSAVEMDANAAGDAEVAVNPFADYDE